MYSFSILVLAVPFLVTLEAAQLNRLSAPDPYFKKYELVQPILQHARTKRELPNGRDESGSYPPETTLTLKNNIILDLRLNLDLLAENFVISYQKNGRNIHYKPKNEEKEFCHYEGTVRGKPNSWVAVSTCRGVEAAIYDGHTLTYIQQDQGSATYEHFFYDHSDWSQPFQCEATSAVTNNTNNTPQKYPSIGFSEEQEKRTSKDHWYKKQTPDSMKMDEEKSHLENQPWRYVELVLVADKSIFVANKKDLSAVSHQMKTLANVVNRIYNPLNISIILVGVVVWNEKDLTAFSRESSGTTLTDFAEYRRTKLVKEIPNDNAFLITEKEFNKDIITESRTLGIASVGTMCSSFQSCGIVTIGKSSGPLALILAHEIGHNFGMAHDNNTICKCPDKKCVMYPSTSEYNPVHWSSCSLNDLKMGFSKGLDYCLRNKPKRLINFSVCGNGFVETGEQCDCGTVSDPGAVILCHKCCDPKTCMLRANATCGTGQCCDLQTCRPKSASTACRSAKSECDLAEYCTGESGNCPDDAHKMDTTPCGQGEQAAHCVRGECHSHTDQCRLIWGAESKTSDAYDYDVNTQSYDGKTEGKWFAGCGYDITTLEAKQCKPQDTMCGRLYCKCQGLCELQLTNRLHERDKDFSKLNRNFSFVISDLGLSVVDPGLVPDGAICGQDKMCFNQECISVTELRTKIVNNKTLPCPSDCSGHGICNSGHCDCERGYVPPLCTPPASIITNDYETTTNDPIRPTKPGPTAGTDRFSPTIGTGPTEGVPKAVTTSEPNESGSATNKTGKDSGPLHPRVTFNVLFLGVVLVAVGLVVGLIYYFRKSGGLRNLLRFSS